MKLFKPKKNSENTDRWLTTYADIITNLLVFFVLLYAISIVDVVKFQEMASSLKTAFGTGLVQFMEEGTQSYDFNNLEQRRPVVIFDRFVPPVIKSVDKIGEDFYRGNVEIKEEDLDMEHKLISDEETELLGIAREMNEKLSEAELSENVTISLERGVLIIRIQTEGVLFESGSAELKNDILALLNIIAGSLKFYKGIIMVEGHTDNVPINTARYPSNWELSTSRAVSVLKYWIDNKMILPGDIAAAGYADTKSIDTNDTVEGRAKNRRVEVLVLGREKSRAFRDFES